MNKTLLKNVKMIKINKLLTTGLVKSPNVLHKSEIVMNPTNNTMKSPTNLTEIQQASIVPVNISQHHHDTLKSGILNDETFTAPKMDPTMKHKSIGSSRMYCVNVNKPTSAILTLFH